MWMCYCQIKAWKIQLLSSGDKKKAQTEGDTGHSDCFKAKSYIVWSASTLALLELLALAMKWLWPKTGKNWQCGKVLHNIQLKGVQLCLLFIWRRCWQRMCITLQSQGGNCTWWCIEPTPARSGRVDSGTQAEMISITSLLWEQLVQNWKTWAHLHFELKNVYQNIPFCRDCMHLSLSLAELTAVQGLS